MKLVATLSTYIVLQWVITCSVFFIQPIESTVSHTRVVPQICHQSPHHQLCVETLRSSIHHKSKDDVVGFTHMVLEMAHANASAGLEHARSLYMKANNPSQRASLASSLATYNMIVNVHLRMALEALNNGDYNIVKQRAGAAGIQASLCDKKFDDPAKSPLKDTNRYVQNLCAITVSIVNNLLPQANSPAPTST